MEISRVRGCLNFCVQGGFHTLVPAKRSPYMTANWFIAARHSIGGSYFVGEDVAQGQPQELGGRLVAGEVPAGLDDLAQLHVQTLDGVGGVDHPAHLRREGEERDHVLPGPPPGLGDGGVLRAPGPGREVLIESYAGPHDWLSSFRYDPANGNLIKYGTIGGAAYTAYSAAAILPATPFAIATAFPSYAVVPSALPDD